MAAPLIIKDQRDRPDQQEIVVMLADFNFTPPDLKSSLLSKKGGSMPGYGQRRTRRCDRHGRIEGLRH